MKIYLDCCCFKRPTYDQSNPIVHLESEAIKIIISLCKRKAFSLVSSEVLEFEINKTLDILRRERLKILENLTEERIKMNEMIEKRAKYFEKSGIQSFDALHLACVETRCDLLKDNGFEYKSNDSIRIIKRVFY